MSKAKVKITDKNKYNENITITVDIIGMLNQIEVKQIE